jgi:hypothetical protein
MGNMMMMTEWVDCAVYIHDLCDLHLQGQVDTHHTGTYKSYKPLQAGAVQYMLPTSHGQAGCRMCIHMRSVLHQPETEL